MNDNKKNEWAAAIASFFIAGWGQVYNGESWIKGAGFFFWRFIGILVFFITINFIMILVDGLRNNIDLSFISSSLTIFSLIIFITFIIPSTSLNFPP